MFKNVNSIRQIIANFLSFSLFLTSMIFAETTSNYRQEILMQEFPLGSQIRITRLDNSVIKGKLINFEKASLFLESKGKEIEISYTEIKKIEKDRNIGRLIIGISAISVLILLPYLIGGA